MNRLSIRLVRSSIGCTETQIRTLHGLGLRKTQQVVVHSNTPSIRGMVKKVIHLLKVEEIEG